MARLNMSRLNLMWKYDQGGEALSRALGSLPQRIPPPGLTTSLRVIASRERQRTLARRSFPAALEYWGDRLRLAAIDVMRPLALPAAGGVFSAVVLLGMWVVPTYPLRATSSFDVPTMVTTEATVKDMMPIAGLGNDMVVDAADAMADPRNVVVDVTVDDQGRLVDYTIVSGPSSVRDPVFLRRLENLLLFTEFVPATAFGRPEFSKMRVTLLSSYVVDVKG